MEEKSSSLLSFSDDIQIEQNITEEDKMLIEVKLWTLLGRWTERYTMGDSTSVPVEIAEELLKSICFSLGLELKGSKNPTKVLIEEDLEELLKASWRKIEAMIAIGKKLLEEVRKTSANIENISYNDTLNEIQSFFNKYDYRFFAHKIECSYPRIEVSLLMGNIENIFLSFKYEAESNEAIFIDNGLMDNEKLCILIDEINDCGFISDKIAIVRKEVKSIGDLVEILNVCFWGEEAIELFKAFSKGELYLIKYYLDKEVEYTSETSWEIEFNKYLKDLDIKKYTHL